MVPSSEPDTMNSPLGVYAMQLTLLLSGPSLISHNVARSDFRIWIALSVEPVALNSPLAAFAVGIIQYSPTTHGERITVFLDSARSMRIIIRTDNSRPCKPLGCMYYVIQYMLRYVMLYIPKNWQKSGLSNAPGFVQIGPVTSEILAPSKILISPDVLRTLTLARLQSGPFWPVWGPIKSGKIV